VSESFRWVKQSVNKVQRETQKNKIKHASRYLEYRETKGSSSGHIVRGGAKQRKKNHSVLCCNSIGKVARSSVVKY